MQKKQVRLEDLPEVLDVKDIMLFLRVGRNSAYNLIKQKTFYSVSVGRRIKIPKPAFVQWYLGGKYAEPNSTGIGE